MRPAGTNGAAVAATIGIGLVGIAVNMELSPAVTAGAVISGAYFGDKSSPLSDTANLAAMFQRELGGLTETVAAGDVAAPTVAVATYGMPCAIAIAGTRTDARVATAMDGESGLQMARDGGFAQRF